MLKHLKYNQKKYKIGGNMEGEYLSIETAKRIAEKDKEIEEYLAQHGDNKVHFHFVDIPAVYKNIFKGSFYW